MASPGISATGGDWCDFKSRVMYWFTVFFVGTGDRQIERGRSNKGLLVDVGVGSNNELEVAAFGMSAGGRDSCLRCFDNK